MKYLVSMLFSLFAFTGCDFFSANTNSMSEIIEQIQNQRYERPLYSLIASEKQEKVCSTKDSNWCAHTTKRVVSSNDGFTIEMYHSDGPDSVGCNTDAIYPCSTIGDTGAGKDELHVTNEQTNQTITVTGSEGSIYRTSTPMHYPYLLITNFSGGAGCCFSYLIYLKNNLHLTPFKIKDTRSDYFFATKDNRLFFALWEELPGSKSNNRNTKEPYYIEDLIEKHFEEQL